MDDDAWTWFNAKLKDSGYESLSHLGREINVPKTNLSRYFHLQREVPVKVLAKLCSALSVSPEELLQVLRAYEWDD